MLFKKKSKETHQEDESTPESVEIDEAGELLNREKDIDTVKDFIENLKLHYDFTDDEELKRRLAHQIVKIELALGKPTPSLRAEDLKVRETEDGVLGYYEPYTDVTALSHDMLEDFNTDQTLLNHVVVHESLHAKGYSDESIVELKVKKLISAKPGIYPNEQRRAKSTFFHTGINKALTLYDIEKPDELCNYYLEVELEKLWNDKLRSRFKKEQKRGKLDAAKILERIAQDVIKRIENDFEKGVQRLYDMLKVRGFDFKKKNLLIFWKNLSKRSLLREGKLPLPYRVNAFFRHYKWAEIMKRVVKKKFWLILVYFLYFYFTKWKIVSSPKKKLAKLLGEAEKAHIEYEKKLGHRDEDWPSWYADYIVKKIAGAT